MARALLLLFATLSPSALFSAAEASIGDRTSRQQRHSGYQIALTDRARAQLPTLSRRGEHFILGVWGERYQIRIRNHERHRVEVVLTVDGRDVINGRVGSDSNRGYIVGPESELIVEGFRQSASSVATFRFTDPQDSYSRRLGDSGPVGVIGAAFFPERRPPSRAAPRRPKRRERSLLEALLSAPLSDLAPPSASAALEVPFEGVSSMGQASRAARLGTRYGEERLSRSRSVRFNRASQRPAHRVTLYYDNAEGLEARGLMVPSSDHRSSPSLRKGQLTSRSPRGPSSSPQESRSQAPRRAEPGSTRGIHIFGGALDLAQLQQVIQYRSRALRTCYQDHLRRRGIHAGELNLQFVITASGHRGRVRGTPRVVGNWISPRVAGQRLGRCIARRVKRWRFPAPTGGDVTVTYPFVFTSS